MPAGNDSISIFVGFLVWAPVAVWVYSLVSWSIMGEIAPVFGIVGAFLGIVLGVAVMLQPNADLQPIMVLGVCTLVAVFAPLRSMMQRRELAMIDIESIERAYEQLGERPDGFGPKIRIARLIHARGLRGHAVVLAEEALKPFPRSIVEDDLRQVRMWKAQTTPDDYSELTCLECGLRNRPGTLFCTRCHAPILLAYARGAWTGKRTARRLMAAWIASMAGLIGIPLAAGSMPPVLAGITVTMLLAGSGALVFVAFRPEPTR